MGAAVTAAVGDVFARCVGVSCFDGATGAAAEATAPSPAITATIAPTGATSPAPTRISERTPADVAGTSIETLSVSISNRLSPGFTASPADLNHLVILPSATVSPSCGMRMFMMDERLYQFTDTYWVSK